MALLLPSNVHHEFTLDLAETAKSLGIKLTVTEKTIQEFLEVLNQANNRWRDLRKVRSSLLRIVDDEFIRSYLREREKTPQGWYGYYYSMRQVDKLLAKHGISVLSLEDEEIKEKRNLLENEKLHKQARRWVYDYALIRTNTPKADSVVEHDAFHLLLVRDLRRNPPPDIFGPQSWFLTYDLSLPHVDDEINKTVGIQDCPSSVHPRTWIGITTPFLSPKSVEEDLPKLFSKLMKSDFAHVPFSLSTETLIEVAGPWLDYDNLTDDDIYAILTDKSVQEIIGVVEKFEIF